MTHCMHIIHMRSVLHSHTVSLTGWSFSALVYASSFLLHVVLDLTAGETIKLYHGLYAQHQAELVTVPAEI